MSVCKIEGFLHEGLLYRGKYGILYGRPLYTGLMVIRRFSQMTVLKDATH